MYDFKPAFLDAAIKAAKITEKALVMILRQQGHRLTGKLEKSIEFSIEYDRAKLSANITVFVESYGIPLSTGVPAARIPYTRGSGAGKSKLIQGLTEFARLRGLGQNDAENTRIAFAIVQAWKRDGGSPTKASKRFSKTGQRTGALEETVKTVEPLIADLIRDIFGRSFTLFITDYLPTIIK